MKHAEQEPFPPIYVDSKKENEVCIHRVGNVDILTVKLIMSTLLRSYFEIFDDFI